ncbi:hypothetical protein [Frankia gtarii]|uniref:hypothetical protein n=1 Tax=Frankia gtarii TaxID=2950102 RepID=UPI0021BE153D|nr:hypothetical protein [Frankia gtarii]
MSAAAGLAATLDLRSCSRECVLGRPFTPGTLRTLLHRHVGFDVDTAERLLIISEAHAAAASLAGLDALIAGRPAASVLLVLVGPGPNESTAPRRGETRASAGTGDGPGFTAGAWGNPLAAVPAEETLPDLDAPYNPALYDFVDDTATLDDTAEGADTAEGDARPTGAAACPPSPSYVGAIPAIIWVEAVEGVPCAAPVDPPGSEVCAAGESAPAGPERLDDDARDDDARDDGPALRALLSALRSPEVFDQLTRTVPAMPGVIGFVPRAVRPDPAPWETNRADPAESVEPGIEIVWTAATRGAGVLRLAPVRGAGVLEVQFPDLRP